MVIRLVTKQDLVCCGEIYSAAFSTPPYREMWDPASATEMLAGLLHRDPDSCWAIEMEDGIAGFAFCTTYGIFRATIQEFAIAPPYQRQGLGHRLMEYVLDRFREQNIRSIDLVVNRDAPAFMFYRKFSFRQPERYVLMAKWL